MNDIYQEYSKAIYNYLLSLTKNQSIAEELLQETFYSAIKNISKFKKESSLKTWLYKIAKNKWNDYCKKNNKLNEVSLNEESKELLYSAFEEDIFNKDILINIFKKIHKLDETSKEIIYLRIGTNFNFKEISNIVGKTEANVKVIFHRAKIKLKEDLKNE